MGEKIVTKNKKKKYGKKIDRENIEKLPKRKYKRKCQEKVMRKYK